MEQLQELEPKLLWKHFSNICSTPRPSGFEGPVISFIEEFARGLGYPVQKDEYGNILIRKSASEGKVNSPAVVLQSHLDMVPQKNSDKKHDFRKDPVEPYLDGEWVKAKGTTLGADNGIGVAAMLAILENNKLKHGPLELLFTVDEETGMSGAKGLSPQLLTARKYINLDSEEEGKIYIGCAGGINSTGMMSYQQEKSVTDKVAYELAIKGLRGGHSGIDINLGRANAIKLMNRLLFAATEKFDINIGKFTGGSARNAIPREAFATVTVPGQLDSQFNGFITEYSRILEMEFAIPDPGISLELTRISIPDMVMSNPVQSNLIRAVYACPDGVIRMDDRVKGLVQTSNNLSFIKCHDGKSVIKCLLRSSVDSARKDLENSVLSALSLAGFNVEFSGAYPGWKPDPSSELLAVLKNVYEKLYRKSPQVQAIHAGLECGIIGAHYPDMDMVSCGPTIQYPHSPDERVNILSVKQFWNFLVSVLEQL